MLEHVPAWLGRLLVDRRAGMDKIVAARADMAGAGVAGLALSSPAFADGGRLPERFTDDGEGTSPPLIWTGAPAGSQLALIVEDPDAPAAKPLVHAIVWGLAGETGRLAEGALSGEHATGGVVRGRNSFGGARWLPPDPPPGHGEHRYAFQLIAFASETSCPDEGSGRKALIAALAGRIQLVDVLIGTYSRGEVAPIGPIGDAVPA